MQKSLIQMKKIILLLCNAYRKYTKLKLHIETEKLKKKYLHFFEVSSALLLAVKTRLKINFSADREFKTLMTKNDKNDKIDKKNWEKFKSTKNNNLSTSRTAERHARGQKMQVVNGFFRNVLNGLTKPFKVKS